MAIIVAEILRDDFWRFPRPAPDRARFSSVADSAESVSRGARSVTWRRSARERRSLTVGMPPGRSALVSTLSRANSFYIYDAARRRARSAQLRCPLWVGARRWRESPIGQRAATGPSLRKRSFAGLIPAQSFSDSRRSGHAMQQGINARRPRVQG